MTKSDVQKLIKVVDSALLAINVVDDELEAHGVEFKESLVRCLLERCRDYCSNALLLLPKDP